MTFRWRLVQEGAEGGSAPQNPGHQGKAGVVGEGLGSRRGTPVPSAPASAPQEAPVWGRPQPPVGYSKLMQTSLFVGPPLLKTCFTTEKLEQREVKRLKTRKLFLLLSPEDPHPWL